MIGSCVAETSLESERWFRPRDFLVTSVFLLVSVGTVLIFSASAFHWSVQGDSTFFLRRQLIWLPIAFAGCYLMSRINPQVLQRYHWQFLLVSMVLLAVVLVPQLGRNVNASRRWLPLGGGLQFQPSELAKLAVIVFVAGFMSRDVTRRNKFLRGFLAVCFVVLPLFALILAEPDFGTAMVVLGLAFTVLVLSGVRKIFFFASFIIFAPIIAAFAYWRWEQIQVRLLGFFDPEKLYQVKHSLTALGSGGLSGLGLGESGQKLQFLPEPHTDFIVAILGEELGFLGCLGLILVFLVLLWSGAAIVWRTKELFPFLLGAGIIVSLASQAAFNIAVVTASAPTKGIPLPFITFGGSGLCMTLAQIGILLSIDRANRFSAASRAESP